MQPPEPAAPGRIRRARRVLATGGAALLVWWALVAPNELARLTPLALVRIPLEGLVILALAVILPRRGRRALALVVGAVLGVLATVKLIDLGFSSTLARPFDPVADRGYAGDALGVLGDSIGTTPARIVAVLAVLLVVGLLVLTPLALVRVTDVAARHQRHVLGAAALLAVAWAALAATGAELVRRVPVASRSAATIAYDHARVSAASIRDARTFADVAERDPLRVVPSDRLLEGLRGKDVLFLFVESYGRVAVQDSSMAPGVSAVLDAGTASLARDGFAARSAFLTSPTFGGISWLAHATLQSGLRIGDQQRHDVLMGTDRITLSRAFQRAGWRTVSDAPSNGSDWPAGRDFYRYDQLYHNGNVGYRGPSFSYARQPDQYILAAFQRLELADPAHPPVMAEIDLVSSHVPWAPLPRLVPWDEIGDGSLYRAQIAGAPSAKQVWRSQAGIERAYGQSIEYSLGSIISFAEEYGDDDLVLVVLGDHQPGPTVSGEDAGHDVPISIIARDPAVLAAIDGWGWDAGLRPSPGATVWPMEAFRDRFVAAFGAAP